MKFQQLAKESFVEACKGLLPPLSSSSRVAIVSTDSPPFSLASVIGFTSSRVRGTIGIAATRAGSLRLLKAFPTQSLALDGGDAMGELSNILLGNLKRAWNRHGISVSCAVPVIIRGCAVEVQGTHQSAWSQIGSYRAGDDFVAWMDIHVGPESTIAATPTESVDEFQLDSFGILEF